jgi:hypothetical protein
MCSSTVESVDMIIQYTVIYIYIYLKKRVCGSSHCDLWLKTGNVYQRVNGSEIKIHLK